MIQTATPSLADKDLHAWLSAEGFPADDINAAGQHGLTPLMRACRSGDATKVTALLQRGARLDIKNADGNNALWLACVGADLEVIASTSTTRTTTAPPA